MTADQQRIASLEAALLALLDRAQEQELRLQRLERLQEQRTFVAALRLVHEQEAS